MPRLPRDLSGKELIKKLSKSWGYEKTHQTGSHVVLETKEPSTHQIVVPEHKNLRIGTLNSILRMVSAHKDVSREDILDTLK